MEHLAQRIATDGTQANPVVCVERSTGDFVLLDGATRTEALKRLGYDYVVVQVVDPATVLLHTWNHVVRGTTSEEVLRALASHRDLRFGGDTGAPRLCVPAGPRRTIEGPGLSQAQILNSIVSAYIGHWRVNRLIEADLETVEWRFPDWAAVIEFPELTVEEVAQAAIGGELLPAGVTRFVVPDRALRLKVGLDLLRGSESIGVRQQELDDILAERAHQGRIRRYEEPVVVLDD